MDIQVVVTRVFAFWTLILFFFVPTSLEMQKKLQLHSECHRWVVSIQMIHKVKVHKTLNFWLGQKNLNGLV
jgi:hypothetical protein